MGSDDGRDAGRRSGGTLQFPPATGGGAGCEAGDRPPSRAKAGDSTEKDMAFLDAMTPGEAEKYMGEWIAVSGGGIVAHGRDPDRVCQSARDAGAMSPYMRYIFASPDEVPWLYAPKQ